MRREKKEIGLRKISIGLYYVQKVLFHGSGRYLAVNSRFYFFFQTILLIKEYFCLESLHEKNELL